MEQKSYVGWFVLIAALGIVLGLVIFAHRATPTTDTAPATPTTALNKGTPVDDSGNICVESDGVTPCKG